MMKPVFYLIVVMVVAVLYLIRARILGKQLQIYILKPFATLVVITVALLSFLNPDHNTVYTAGILTGLLFSLGGDIALLFQENRKAFTLGLGLFFVVHVIYILIFTVLGSFSVWDVITLLVLLAAGSGFYNLIKSNLKKLQIPVIIYIVVISLMVSRAVSTLFNLSYFSTEQAVMISLGAILFYFSDLILAANRFWKPWQYHHISLVFYYGGQLLIALAAGYFG